MGRPKNSTDKQPRREIQLNPTTIYGLEQIAIYLEQKIKYSRDFLNIYNNEQQIAIEAGYEWLWETIERKKGNKNYEIR